jgi:YLP motif-containing protein 1
MRAVSFVPLQVCFKRNVHGRTLKEIQKLANGWEASPAMYTLLDVSGLFQDDAGADKVSRQMH